MPPNKLHRSRHAAWPDGINAADKENEITSHEKQRQADKAHHEGRIAWLTSGAPLWSCGTPVARHMAAEMLLKSREALRYIDEHGMSTNSADANAA